MSSGKSGLNAVLDSLVDHAILTLDRKGRVTTWNRAAMATKGYTAREIIGRHFSCFYEDADIAAGVPDAALRAAAEAGRHEAEGWRVRKNGERFWANVVIQPLRDPRGRIRGFVKVTRDISQQVRAARLREEIDRLRQFELVGQVTGGLAHDFNNLLTAMDAGMRLIGDYSQDERIARILDVTQVGLDRSKRLIAQLMAYSRKQVLNSVASGVNELTTVFDMLIQKAVGNTIAVEWKLMGGLPLVMVDRGQFQSALLNLVMNARDAVASGGVIKISTRTEDVAASAFPPPFDVPAGAYVVIEVSDTGAGMSPSTREHAIEPFYSTKPVGAGSGLGLSQSYGFARQSKGTLIIESEEGVGTRVSIYLPAMRPAMGGDAGVPLKTKVLLVDDDYAVRTLVSEMLRLRGYDVMEAEDAHDALRQLQTDASIDCVISDIVMPNNMNGVDLMNAARALRHDVPILLASGYSRDMLRDSANLPDNVSYLSKPYNIGELSEFLSGFKIAC